MVTRELKSLVKLSEKKGRFDYYDGLVYYMMVVYKVPIVVVPDRMNRFIPKFNKFLRKDLGIKISKEGVMPVSLSKGNEDDIHDKLGSFSPNYFYQESTPGVFFSPLVYGHKLTYKIAKAVIICRLASSRFFNSLLDSRIDIGDVDEFVRKFIIRDEHITDSMIRCIPSEINPVILDESYMTYSKNDDDKFDPNDQYTFQFDELHYLRDRYTETGSLEDTNPKGFQMLCRATELSKRWLFSDCKTIEEFLKL